MTDFSYISSNCDVDNALKLFREMLRIRAVEEEIAQNTANRKCDAQRTCLLDKRQFQQLFLKF